MSTTRCSAGQSCLWRSCAKPLAWEEDCPEEATKSPEVSLQHKPTTDRLIDKNTDARVIAPGLPLANYPVFNFGQLAADAQLIAEIAQYYLDWLAHPDYDDYWKQWSIEEHFPTSLFRCLKRWPSTD